MALRLSQMWPSDPHAAAPALRAPPLPQRWLLVLAVLVGLDLAFSFAQYCQLRLDGDLARIAMPSAWYRAVLHDPFGWAVLTRGAEYAAPNRFFAHIALLGYVRGVPLALQQLGLAPLASVYVAAGLFRTLSHALLLGLLATYIRRASTGERETSWLAAAVLAPLFQTEGFDAQMGLIAKSWTYSFFYDFPLALLLAALLPLYQAVWHNAPPRLGPVRVVALGALMVVLSFNGPSVAATMAVLLAMLAGSSVWHYWHTGQRPAWWSAPLLGLLAWFGVLCIYSLYLGRFNAENSHPHSLGELYQLLPLGVFYQLTSKLGLPLLVAAVALNGWLIRHHAPSAEGRRIRQALRWLAVFAAAYVLLLPLGGYRPYRPYLLRNDSVLPVLLGLVYAYGSSTIYLLRHLSGRMQHWYGWSIVLFSLIFINADRRLLLRENNDCERQALAQLSRTPAPLVRLPTTCPVLGWVAEPDPASSADNADLLQWWHVVPTRRLYYQ